MDGLLLEGLLTTEEKRQRQWIKAGLVKKMAEKMIEDAIENGTTSWDVAVSRILSVVAMYAFGCRSGDMTVSNGYNPDYCLKWGDLRLRLNSTSQGS
ncbi:hypothetical protein N0V92_010160 [Colletotrichum tropicale]|nr:hypothetical protein N0V92_010160 [Colletotrichum tropicale]